ncbi:hypothetical protein BDN72DRAFT_204681 [Pluteus cervinus]|uniref:Uncharacterized protein n=1 Tax=Pluteus cervinus TaxID=181527 RepID=A0ACD3AHD2_9AGAR|nr:hypothetical protein BDN72DRAFT_204681 [Pluteus cervinus]
MAVTTTRRRFSLVIGSRARSLWSLNVYVLMCRFIVWGPNVSDYDLLYLVESNILLC